MTDAVNVYEIVERQEQQFQQVLSVSDITWEKEKQFAVQALQNNDFLNKTAWGNQESLKNAVINVASVGISLNPALKHAYLVPRKSQVCLDISYQGLLHLAQDSGAILWGQSKLVYANDNYVNQGIDSKPIHEQQTFGDKGEIVGCYCTVKVPNGDYLTEEMDIAALNKIKEASASNKGPWKTWPEQMMRKAVVKRAYNYWPKATRLSEAAAVLNEHEGIDFEQQEKDIIPTTDSETLNVLLEEAEPVCDFLSAIDQAVDIESLNTIIKDVKTMAEGDRKTAIRKAWTLKKNSL